MQHVETDRKAFNSRHDCMQTSQALNMICAHRRRNVGAILPNHEMRQHGFPSLKSFFSLFPWERVRGLASRCNSSSFSLSPLLDQREERCVFQASWPGPHPSPLPGGEGERLLISKTDRTMRVCAPESPRGAL